MMNPEFKDIVDLVRALAWPSVSLSLVLTFRREAKEILRAVIERGSKVSAFGVNIELAAELVASERLMQLPSPDVKTKSLRVVEIAKAAARKFDYWMMNYKHPPDRSHRENLLVWLVADNGARCVLRDYDVFKALAEVASKMGYDTLPAPSEAEFNFKIKDAYELDTDRRIR
jgi:hypothetical protein